MNITKQTEKEVSFASLYICDVFEYNASVWMKIIEQDGGFNAVNLETGTSCKLPLTSYVIPKEANLTIGAKK